MKRWLRWFPVVALTPAMAAGPTANLRDGVMLRGYDPVSYFEAPAPLKGKPEITHTVDGLTYRFATEANKTKFAAAPAKYAPAYEGWCATAVADGYKYDVDPESFQITGGRLFLFYKGWRGDAKKRWLKDEPTQLRKADENWPKVKLTEE